MKSKLKGIALLFVISLQMTGVRAVAIEKTKEFHEKWTVSAVQTLQVINKFGEVKVNSNGGSEVTVDVVVTVEASSESRANDLLDQIHVTFGKTGGTARAETEIDNNFKSRNRFSIDYTINIPTDKNLNISNKYGNTIVNELNASGEFDIQYGNFTANALEASSATSMRVSLSYGKAEINSTSDIDVDVKYSTINFGEMDNLKLLSKYSVVNIEEAKAIKIDSKYDTFNFEEIEALEALTKYSHFKIGELKKKLKIDSGYGGIRVDQVTSGFESISIENSYGQIKLGLDDASYSLDASCSYCGISYPEEEFTGNRMSENTSKTVKGKVGKAAGGTVYIRSRYGEIKLDE